MSGIHTTKDPREKRAGVDLVPIHRLTIPSFRYLEPFAGLGLSFNYWRTADLEAPLQGGGTTSVTGHSGLKLGLMFAWGTNIPINNHFVPFIEMKHCCPSAVNSS